MKRVKNNGILFLPLLIAIAMFITSCGKSAALATLPPPPDAGNGPAAQTTPVGQTRGAADMTITWGYGSALAFSGAGSQPIYYDYTIGDKDINLANELGDRFNVTIKPVEWSNNYYQSIDDSSVTFNMANMPDVSFVMDTKQDILDSGATREIPMDMIKQYAPRYADLLAQYQDYLSDYYYSDDGSGLYGLPACNTWNDLA